MIDSPISTVRNGDITTLHSQKNLETHQNRLSRFFSSIPNPASQHRQHQVVNTILSRRISTYGWCARPHLAGWPVDICERDQRPDHADFTG